jgi:radical SAM protein with 4Fe4S-binding SPASM domain
MEIRFNIQVHVRHATDESVVWCPRTGGCTVLRNAQPILEEMNWEWRSVDEIAHTVAEKFSCDANEVREDVEAVVKELVSQRFVEVDGKDDTIEEWSSTDEMPVIQVNGQDAQLTARAGRTPYQDDDWSPLGDFYVRHGLPSELHMDLTDGCNEKCVHCYLLKGGTHYLNKDIAFKVLKEFREAQGLTVLVSGGECMLHRDFAEILRYAKSLDLNVIVLSNLTLCDDRMVALLKEIDPQFVNVSLYAVTESVHDSITQIPGSCKKTKSAIDALQAAGVHVRIATPFMRENKNCVEELKEYASARHVHLVADSEIFGQIDHSCTNQRHALSIQELELLLSSHKDVFEKGRIEPEKCLCDAKVCDIGEGRLNLDAEGKYYPCDGFHGAIIGDARKESVWDVWNGAALNRLRSLKNRDFGSCASCADRAWCKVCPMRNYNETGDMLVHAPWRCEATRLYRKIFEEK